jgi:prevent-host-death family protein
MIVYTYSEARQNLADLLDQAAAEGEVLIQRRDGQTFVVMPQIRAASPLDVGKVDVRVTSREIVAAIYEGRARMALAEDRTQYQTKKRRENAARASKPKRPKSSAKTTVG